MCLLTVFPSKVQPDEKRLISGAKYNDGGHGFAIIINGQVMTRRGMRYDSIIDEFMTIRQAHPEGPALFHSRIPTHGVEAKTNCHPFRVPIYRDTFLAHNGILPELVHPGGKDRRSDTKVFAEDFLPIVRTSRKTSLVTDVGRRWLEKWMGSYNKMAIITTDPNFRGNLFILNEGSGDWNDGVWYSNTSYQPNGYRWSSQYEGDDEDYAWGYVSYDGVYREYRGTTLTTHNHDLMQDCLFCGGIGSVGKYSAKCYHCHSCTVCAEASDDCKCQLPATFRVEQPWGESYTPWPPKATS